MRILILCLLAATFYASCKQSEKFSGKSGTNPPAEVVVSPSPSPANPEFLKLTPALLVKRANCVMCHSKISGDVVTDFNIDVNPLAQRDFAKESMNDDSFRPQAFYNANIDGKFIVPQSSVTGSFLTQFQRENPSLALPLSIKDAMKTPYFAEQPGWEKRMFPIISGDRNKENPGVNSIEEKANLKITPPTTKEISDLKNSDKKKVLIESKGEQVFSLSENSFISGLKFESGVSSQFVKNETKSVSCIGDILITTSLLLDQAEFKTTEKDCRLYVMGTIFIKGNLSVSDVGEKGSLQLATGKAVLSGIKKGRNELVSDEVYADMKNLVSVLDDSGYSSYIVRRKSDNKLIAYTVQVWNRMTANGNLAVTAAEQDTAMRTFANAAAAHWTYMPGEARLSQTCAFDLGGSLLFDGSSVTCKVTHAAADMSSRVERGSPEYIPGNISHVLIAAPLFMTKQKGGIEGAIVAGFALGILNDFKFTADAKLKNADVFPMLKRKLIEGLD